MQQTWDPSLYAGNGRFVAVLAGSLVDSLQPRAGDRVLDLGCGDGFLTQHIGESGAAVVGVDSSPQMIAAAKERGVDARLINGEALPFQDEFDAVFSNAALHWMSDHDAVLAGVYRALKPGGSYGLVCFRPEGGSGYTDEQVYQRASLGGGLGYSEDALRALWDHAPFRVRELRQMHKTDGKDQCFGQGFLWVLLARRRR